MKQLTTLVLVLAVLVMAGSADAKGKSKSKKPHLIEGVITSVGANSFYISYNNANVQIDCNGQTAFHGGDVSSIKVGVKVGVSGMELSPIEINALNVTINPKAETKKSKSSN